MGRTAAFKPGAPWTNSLWKAVSEDDAELAMTLLKKCKCQEDIDDVKYNTTAFMVAVRRKYPRVNDDNDDKYLEMIKLFWSRYKELGCDMRAIMTRKLNCASGNWMVYNHAHLGGHWDIVKLVLGFYREVYDDEEEFRRELQNNCDIPFIAHGIKGKLASELGEKDVLSFRTSSNFEPRSVRTRSGRTIAPSKTASSSTPHASATPETKKKSAAKLVSPAAEAGKKKPAIIERTNVAFTKQAPAITERAKIAFTKQAPAAKKDSEGKRKAAPSSSASGSGIITTPLGMVHGPKTRNPNSTSTANQKSAGNQKPAPATAVAADGVLTDQPAEDLLLNEDPSNSEESRETTAPPRKKSRYAGIAEQADEPARNDTNPAAFLDLVSYDDNNNRNNELAPEIVESAAENAPPEAATSAGGVAPAVAPPPVLPPAPTPVDTTVFIRSTIVWLENCLRIHDSSGTTPDRLERIEERFGLTRPGGGSFLERLVFLVDTIKEF